MSFLEGEVQMQDSRRQGKPMDQEVRKLPEEVIRALSEAMTEERMWREVGAGHQPRCPSKSATLEPADEAGKVHDAQGHFTEQRMG